MDHPEGLPPGTGQGGGKLTCCDKVSARTTQTGLGSHGRLRFRVSPGRALKVSEYRKLSRTKELKGGESGL